MTEKTIKASKKVVDWTAIEPEYRDGLKTTRELGAMVGASHVAVQKAADRLGWTRNLVRLPGRTQPTPVRVGDGLEGAGFVYVIYMEVAGERLFKIGMTSHFNGRMQSHQCSSPFELYVACCYFVPSMRAEEKVLHAQFGDKRVRGEWFRLDATDLEAIARRSLIA